MADESRTSGVFRIIGTITAVILAAMAIGGGLIVFGADRGAIANLSQTSESQAEVLRIHGDAITTLRTCDSGLQIRIDKNEQAIIDGLKRNADARAALKDDLRYIRSKVDLIIERQHKE